MKLRIKTDDLSKEGIYEIKISGRVQSSPRVSFALVRIEIRDPCLRAVIVPSEVPHTEIKAGSGLKKVMFLPW